MNDTISTAYKRIYHYRKHVYFNEYYHTSLLNNTSINDPNWSAITYGVDQNMYPAGLNGTPGLLGYAFLT